MEDSKLAIGKAKIHLMSAKNSAFLSHCCLSMEHIFDPTVKRAATDGYRCFYNEDFFMSISPAERVGLMLHETLHPAMQHFERQGDRKLKPWNEAGDYSINEFILSNGFKLPPNHLHDHMYDGWLVEKIYNDIVKNQKEQKGDEHEDMKPTGKGGDPKEPQTPEAARELKAHWDDILIQASIADRMAKDAPGSIPGSIQVYLDGLLNPEIPWNRVLASYMSQMSKTSYTMRKTNRRYRPKFMLPTRWSEKICDIMVGVDTSCSVTDLQFHHFVSETAAIIRNLRPETTTFVQYDTSIKSIAKLRDLRDLASVDFKGRGGTCVSPLLDHAIETKPALLIIFTDAYHEGGTLPKPRCPVIWIVNNNTNFEPQFGRHIEYNFRESQ